MAKLNERIKLLRLERNVFQKDVAESCDIALRSFKYYESGERIPDANTLIALADYFDVSLDYLTGRSDNPEINK